MISFQLLNSKPKGRVVVFMGSSSDEAHCEKIRKACSNLGVPCELRVTSAHKQTEQTMRMLHQYEGTLNLFIFVIVLVLYYLFHIQIPPTS